MPMNGTSAMPTGSVPATGGQATISSAPGANLVIGLGAAGKWPPLVNKVESLNSKTPPC